MHPGELVYKYICPAALRKNTVTTDAMGGNDDRSFLEIFYYLFAAIVSGKNLILTLIAMLAG